MLFCQTVKIGAFARSRFCQTSTQASGVEMDRQRLVLQERLYQSGTAQKQTFCGAGHGVEDLCRLRMVDLTGGAQKMRQCIRTGGRPRQGGEISGFALLRKLRFVRL